MRVLVAGLALVPLVSTALAATPGQLCERKAAAALRSCTKGVVRQALRCQQQTGAACAADDPTVAAALATLADKVLDDCPDQATVTAAGWSSALVPAGLVARLSEACRSTAASLVARSFGGPHAAVRTAAGLADRVCLDQAYLQGGKMADYALRQQSACLVKAHAGGRCDPAAVAAKIAARQAKVAAVIAKKCADLQALVVLAPEEFTARATAQGDCLVATTHGRTAPFTLACGPRATVPVPPRGTPTQVVLDGATTNTRCGDGSPYAFWIRLAPAGQPVERVVVFLPGGGSCTDGPGCAAEDPDLFESLADSMSQAGLMSSSAATNPFRDWTKVFLPYCTQDGHAGGGIVNAFPEKTVYRYGGLNVRAALRYVRDVLWAEMDATEADGFRPDRLRVLFSGSSAGGIGVQANYHYLLDDLRWTHTTALSDSALGPDNGAGATLDRGTIVTLGTTPGWGGLALVPPYCKEPNCGEGWNYRMFKQAPRLKAVPEQQILSVSNQVDATQKAVGEFGNMVSFVNAVRTTWCAQAGTPGLHAWLSATTEQNHGNVNKNTIWNQVAVGGVLLRDWVGAAMTAPDAVHDAIATGTLEADIPGVQPFPCTVSSPSGAFL